MSKTREMKGADRKAQLVEAGAKLASKHGAVNVTRRMVAQVAKVSEGLVSLHMGTTAEAQKVYARKAKALGLTLPSKAEAEAIGVKLRKHKPSDKRDARKRGAKEVKAIQRKAVTKRVTKAVKAPAKAAERETAVRKPPQRKPKVAPTLPLPGPESAPLPQPAERKSAARAPKAPPAALPLPPSS